MINRLRLSLLALITLILGSCSETAPEAPSCGFDLQGMLEGMHSGISTRINTAQTAQSQLLSAASAFNDNPNSGSFQDLKNAYVQAYTSYQAVQASDVELAYNFRSTNHFTPWLNSFPTNVDSVNQRIATGRLNLSAASQLVTGFPSLDYLIYGLGSNDAERLTSLQASTNARQLIVNLSQQIANILSEISQEWNDLENAFSSNAGSANGDPLSLLVNALIKDFEYGKNFKLKAPAGRFNGGIAQPERAEAAYSKLSLQLARASYEEQMRLIDGRDQEISVPLLSYVRCLNSGTAERIVSQIAVVDQLWLDLESKGADPFTDPEALNIVNNLINEMQRLTPLLKAEMTSQLNVSITFQDNDGD